MSIEQAERNTGSEAEYGAPTQQAHHTQNVDNHNFIPP